MSLEQLTPGERGEIIKVEHCGGCGGGCHGHGHHHKHDQDKHGATATRAERMGLQVGKIVEVLKNDGQLLLLLVDEINIAIDRSIARNVHIKGCAACI